MQVKTYLVEGMFCKNCPVHIAEGIKNISGIEDVIVDVSNRQVRVSGTGIINEEIKEAIEQSGYIYGGEINFTPLNSEHWIG